MKVLLSSVFGPYGVDDAYGRKENIMELFHNQVTREQGLFSLRFHHQSFGLYFIAENLNAPTAVLDFPSEKRFIKEIQKDYDYVGISFIVPNFAKAKRMAELVREHAPRSLIVLGGHGVSIPGVENLIEHDHICKGEGVRWFRRLLGEDASKPLKHPAMPSAFGRKVVGIPLKMDAAVLIPGVGCPNACRFCCTSHFFDKRYTSYLETGDEFFQTCLDIETKLGHTEFFVMDENFLKRPQRARRLMDLMQKHNKFYRFGIFSSAETIADVGVEFIARLGVYFLWLGVESKREIYTKNRGVDLKRMIRELRDHGISVLASGILFLEEHDKTSIWEDIQFVVDLEADLVQFMQLGPLPGTKLYLDYDKQGLLRKDVPYEEWHGQHHIWFQHPHFSPEESARFLREAFRYDYNLQGSSLLRMCQTIIRGYRNLARYTDPYMVRRREILGQWACHYRPVLGVLRKHAHNERVRSLTDTLLAEYETQLGPMTLKQKMLARMAMPYASREARRVRLGKSVYQPSTVITKYRMSLMNLAAQRIEGKKSTNLLNLEINWGKHPVHVELGGIMDRANAKTLARKIKTYLSREEGEVILNLDPLVSIEDEALNRLLRKIRAYHHRVKVVFQEDAEAVREALENLPQEMRLLVVEAETCRG